MPPGGVLDPERAPASHLLAARGGDEVVDRLIDAALACIARVGVGKTTLDDVAREAGVSRATLYRYVPGKQPLLAAVMEAEARRLAATLTGAAAGAADLEDAVVAMLVAAAGWIREHDALQFVLEHEPGVVLPHLAFGGGDRFYAEARSVLAPVLAPHLPGGDPLVAARAAEWCTRVLVSYLTSPSPDVDLADEASVRALVRQFVVPAFVGAATPVPSLTTDPNALPPALGGVTR